MLESQYDGLLCACDFLFEPFRIGFYYGCSVGLLPDRIFQNSVTHGVPSRPTNPARWATLQRFRRKNILTFFCSTPAESAIKERALAYAPKIRVDTYSFTANLRSKSSP